MRALKNFIRLESSAGIVLFMCALLAIVLSNSPASRYYDLLFSTPLAIHVGSWTLQKPFLLWINEGLMTIFFLLIGLEIKREILEGELKGGRRLGLPAMAALGGMLVPALIYIVLNRHSMVALKGWAIPTATDIAFALGILTLFKDRIPNALRLFLTTVAIFDDVGAVVIIALFYTFNISYFFFLTACVTIGILFLLNFFRVMSITPYIIVGILLWLSVLQSGVHATLTGIILALFIPLKHLKQGQIAPARLLEYKLHPWVAFFVLPLFAFANAGVSFLGLTAHQLLSPITIGIVLGLFVGKQVGIGLFSWIAIRFGIGHMPRQTNWLGIYGVALTAGVGFTMSLFIGALAFPVSGEGYEAILRLGVLLGSFLSGVMGYLVLRLSVVDEFS